MFFSPGMISHDVTGGRDLSQNVQACVHGYKDTFGDFLAHFVQKLWSLICLPSTIVAGAGVKGTLLLCSGL